MSYMDIDSIESLQDFIVDDFVNHNFTGFSMDMATEEEAAAMGMNHIFVDDFDLDFEIDNWDMLYSFEDLEEILPQVNPQRMEQTMEVIVPHILNDVEPIQYEEKYTELMGGEVEVFCKAIQQLFPLSLTMTVYVNRQPQVGYLKDENGLEIGYVSSFEWMEDLEEESLYNLRIEPSLVQHHYYANRGKYYITDYVNRVIPENSLCIGQFLGRTNQGHNVFKTIKGNYVDSLVTVVNMDSYHNEGQDDWSTFIPKMMLIDKVRSLGNIVITKCSSIYELTAHPCDFEVGNRVAFLSGYGDYYQVQDFWDDEKTFMPNPQNDYHSYSVRKNIYTRMMLMTSVLRIQQIFPTKLKVDKLESVLQLAQIVTKRSYQGNLMSVWQALNLVEAMFSLFSDLRLVEMRLPFFSYKDLHFLMSHLMLSGKLEHLGGYKYKSNLRRAVYYLIIASSLVRGRIYDDSYKSVMRSFYCGTESVYLM